MGNNLALFDFNLNSEKTQQCQFNGAVQIVLLLIWLFYSLLNYLLSLASVVDYIFLQLLAESPDHQEALPEVLINRSIMSVYFLVNNLGNIIGKLQDLSS